MIEESPIKIKPECHAEKCPVCSGFGTLSYGSKTCHCCEGRCYILIPNKIEERQKERKNNADIFK